jgi:ATP-dependent RNA helicase DeaD
MEKFEKLGLCEHVLKVISNKKFEKPSEIQEKTIPLILEGKDVIAGSATGSGKTLAFGAGMIKNITKGNGIRGLVLTPTRELAEQVAQALEEFAYYKELEVVSVYGGVSMNAQISKLAYADIVVATPGRLLDHLSHNTIDLSKVQFLVLDEADRMWDMGFKEDVGRIVNNCPKEKQTLLFSATISGDLADFSSKYMRSPVEISVEAYVDTSKLKQIYYDVRDAEKFSLLVHLLKHEEAGLIMIFCNTRRNVDFVTGNLKNNEVKANAIHGGMDQSKRIKVLKGFTDSKVSIIVCTDVAARGLDIPGVSHIYNYDLPADHRDYIHRIGRTARAGESGIAVNLLGSRDYDNFSNIQRHNDDMVVSREMTPRFQRIPVKLNDPRQSHHGGVHGRSSRGRGVSLGNGRRTGGRPAPRSRPDSRGRQARGDRNKRSNDGFRGGGRNTAARRDRHSDE